MNDDPRTPRDDADVDPGQPIEALAGLTEPGPSDFVARVRRGIERRSVTSQLVSLSWYAPWIIMLEFLKMFFQLFQSQNGPEGGAS